MRKKGEPEMKKIICGLVAVLLAASLFGCSNSEEKGKTEPSTVSSEAETSSVDTTEDSVQSESSMYVASEVSNRGIGILSVNDDVCSNKIKLFHHIKSMCVTHSSYTNII